MKGKRGEEKRQSVSQSVRDTRIDSTVERPTRKTIAQSYLLISLFIVQFADNVNARVFNSPVRTSLWRTNSVISWTRERSSLDNFQDYILLIPFRFPLEIVFRRMRSPKISSIGDARTGNIPKLFFSVNIVRTF